MTYDLTPRPLNPAPQTPAMTWPNGAKSAVFIGFDVTPKPHGSATTLRMWTGW